MSAEINPVPNHPLPPQGPHSYDEAELDPRVANLLRQLDEVCAASRANLIASAASNRRLDEQCQQLREINQRSAASNQLLAENNQRSENFDRLLEQNTERLRRINETQEETGRLLVEYVGKVEENNANWERAFSNILVIAQRVFRPIGALRERVGAIGFPFPLQLQDSPSPDTTPIEDVVPLQEVRPDNVQQAPTEEQKKKPGILKMFLTCVAKTRRGFYNAVKSICHWVAQKIRLIINTGGMKNDSKLMALPCPDSNERGVDRVL